MSATVLDFITMLVLGDYDSGKTATIRAISEIDVVSTAFPTNAQPNDRTVGMDFGRLTLANDRCLYFLGQPGAYRMPPFDVIDDRFMQRAGILFIVDSSKTDWCSASTKPTVIYERDISLYRDILATDYPHIILANKQDKTDARSPDELRMILGIPNEIPVLPISAKSDPASVKCAVLALLKQMPQDEIVKPAIEKFPIT
jgi:uncharacterized protein